MPPGVSRFAPQNLSNPFTHLNQSHAVHSQALANHQNHNIHSQNLSGHPAFGAGTSANGISLFGPSATNPSLQGGFGAGGVGLDGGGTGLASHAAQLGFAHGAALEQQRSHEASSAMSGAANKGMGGRMREVWKSNLAQEMHILRSLVDQYPYIAMVRWKRLSW